MQNNYKSMTALGLCVLISIFSLHTPRADEIYTGDIQFFGNAPAIGNQGFGSLTVNNGSLINYEGLFIGTGVSGIGEVLISDPGTVVSLNGIQNRIGVGEGGIGSLRVLNGAVLDGAVDPEVCDGSHCNFFVGNAAGSSGELVVSGQGSTLRTITSFVFGGAAVFTQENDGFDFGIPGAEVHINAEIADGALVESQSVNISGGPGGGSPTGTEASYATLHMSNGATWNANNMSISSGPNAHADIRLDSGASMNIDQSLFIGHDASSEPYLALTDGAGLTVNNVFIAHGTGSQVRIEIDNATFSAGNYGAFPSIGSLIMSISNGGVIDAGWIVGVSVQPDSDAFIMMGRDSLVTAGTTVALGYTGTANEAGSCHVVMRPGSIIRAPFVVVGPKCRLVGSGVIEGNLINRGGLVGGGIKVVQP